MRAVSPWPGLAGAAALVLVVAAALLALGNWQMERLAWKEALIARAADRPQEPPVPVPASGSWPQLDVAEMEYRPIRLTGRYRSGREALVFTNLGEPKGRFGGPGFWVVSPFELDGGGTVLVNRGFVPQDRRPSEARDPPPPGTVTVTGLLRPDDAPNWFTPDDRPEEGIYFAREISALSAGLRLEGPVAPFTVDLLAVETPPSGLPQAGETRFAFTNNHLGYAWTWYGLAAALVAVFAGVVWGRFRPAPGSDA